MPIKALKEFLKLEAAGGIILFAAGLLAVICVNFGLAEWYHHIQHLPLVLGSISLSFAHWVNDALMAVFFLVVGMEIKREMITGELSRREQLLLPLLGACGGMLLPASIYYYFNHQSPELVQGWAIPSATDIAFSLGVLSLFGKRVPVSLKVFLTALAILDDLGAIVIIAIYYTHDLQTQYLELAGLVCLALAVLNKFKVRNLPIYSALGIVLWYFVFKSGVHATLAGVALGFSIPLGSGDSSPLEKLMHFLHPWVAYLILPLFSFLNAGVELSGFSPQSIMLPIPLGIALGLFIGKQVGVFTFSWVAIKTGLGQRPTNSCFRQLYAVSIITGIGFTMSLFIGGLAFKGAGNEELVRVGVILGSLASTVLGMLALHFTLPKKAA